MFVTVSKIGTGLTDEEWRSFWRGWTVAPGELEFVDLHT